MSAKGHFLTRNPQWPGTTAKFWKFSRKEILYWLSFFQHLHGMPPQKQTKQCFYIIYLGESPLNFSRSYYLMPSSLKHLIVPQSLPKRTGRSSCLNIFLRILSAFLQNSPISVEVSENGYNLSSLVQVHPNLDICCKSAVFFNYYTLLYIINIECQIPIKLRTL